MYLLQNDRPSNTSATPVPTSKSKQVGQKSSKTLGQKNLAPKKQKRQNSCVKKNQDFSHKKVSRTLVVPCCWYAVASNTHWQPLASVNLGFVSLGDGGWDQLSCECCSSRFYLISVHGTQCGSVVTKGLFKKSIFQWTELFCQTVKLNWQPAFFEFFKKTELLKKCYDKLVLPEMPGGIIYNIFFYQYLCQKMYIFFLKLPFFTTKCVEGLTGFGPKLPTGVNKNCVKDFCWCH